MHYLINNLFVVRIGTVISIEKYFLNHTIKPIYADRS